MQGGREKDTRVVRTDSGEGGGGGELQRTEDTERRNGGTQRQKKGREALTARGREGQTGREEYRDKQTLVRQKIVKSTSSPIASIYNLQ